MSSIVWYVLALILPVGLIIYLRFTHLMPSLQKAADFAPRDETGVTGLIKVLVLYKGQPLAHRQVDVMTVVIDGQRVLVPRGTNEIKVSAGSHDLSVYWRLRLPGKRPIISVVVPPNETVTVINDLPTFIWQMGGLRLAE